MAMRFALLPVLLVLLAGCGSRTSSSGACQNTLPSWRTPGAIGHQVPAFFITVDGNGRLRQSLWLGYRRTGFEAINPKALSVLLSRVSAMRPEPMVILQPEASADCRAVEAIREEINNKIDCAAGRCGEGRGWSELPGGPVVG